MQVLVVGRGRWGDGGALSLAQVVRDYLSA
jgi:hypothetical protein